MQNMYDVPRLILPKMVSPFHYSSSVHIVDIDKRYTQQRTEH